MGWNKQKTKKSFKLRNESVYTNQEKPTVTLLSNLKLINDKAFALFLNHP